MRFPRLAFAAAVLIAALTTPGSAWAASAGINVSAYADAVDPAAATAQNVRFFVPWRNFEPNDPGGMTKRGPKAAGSITTDLQVYVNRVRALGKTPILVVLDAPDWAAGGGTKHKHPREAGPFAAFMGELAAWLADGPGPAPVYEVWNEPDAETFWGGPPNPDLYTDMLRQAHRAVKDADPRATVLVGPTTGNNFAWIEGLYARGAKGSFDGVAVHTDTACSIVGPESFYRDADGRLGQYTFLGYREVRRVMLEHEDDKPIWMTEIGWGTTNAVCASGASAGKKAAGVSEQEQADFLLRGFRCMAQDPYVVSASVFTLRDAPGNDHGLLRADGSPKPALAAFRLTGLQGPGECGDFAPPELEVLSPVEGQRFVDKLDLRAMASDAGVGLGRITYAFDGGREIRNFTESLLNGSAVGLAPWHSSGALSLGEHSVEVSALDRNGNTTRKVVRVTKVAAGALPSTLRATFKLPRKVSCRGRTCTLSGSFVRPKGGASVGGKVSVSWELRNKKGKYRKLVGGLKPASKAFTFKAKLKHKGRWRVRFVYAGVAPYKAVTSKYLHFRVR